MFVKLTATSELAQSPGGFLIVTQGIALNQAVLGPQLQRVQLH